MRTIAVFTLGLALGLSGCLSLQPVDQGTVEQAQSADASAPDAAASDPCITCVTQADRCATEYQTCTGTPKCEALLKCGSEHGCYADGKNMYDCMPPCGAAAGVVTQTDPAVAPFVSVYLCARSKCGAECGS